MDASSDAGKSVSLGECFCNADLCGRYVAFGHVVTACSYGVVLKEVARECETTEDQVIS